MDTRDTTTPDVIWNFTSTRLASVATAPPSGKIPLGTRGLIDKTARDE